MGPRWQRSWWWAANQDAIFYPAWTVSRPCWVNTIWSSFFFFLRGGLNIWCRNTATDTFHPLTAKASLEAELLVRHRGGQSPAHLVRHMGCNSSGSALVLCVAHHPLPLDSCSYRRSCYSAHALSNCPARWLRPNDVASWTRGGTVAWSLWTWRQAKSGNLWKGTHGARCGKEIIDMQSEVKWIHPFEKQRKDHRSEARTQG